MRILLISLFCVFLNTNSVAQDKSKLAKIYVSKAKESIKIKEINQAITYLIKAEEYFGDKATVEFFYLGTKLYLTNKNYIKAKEYVSKFFGLENADNSSYAEEMYLAYVDIEEAMKSSPKKIVKKKKLVDPNVKVSFSIVEEPPIYPGCKGDLMELKVCFTNKLRKHFASKFKTGMVNQLGLSAGKKRLFIQFTVDTNGEIIDIQSKAPHQKIEEEVIRVMKKLPKMEPGKQGGAYVSVTHSIPFTIVVRK